MFEELIFMGTIASYGMKNLKSVCKKDKTQDEIKGYVNFEA